MNMEKKQDVLAGSVLATVAIVMFSATFNMQQMGVVSIGPDFAPRIVAIIIFILSGILIGQGLMKKKNDGEDGTAEDSVTESETEVEKKPNYLSVVLTVLLMAMYVFSLPLLGFFIASAAYLFLQMCLLADKSKRNYFLFIVISVIVSFVVYYLFRSVLHVMLPTGILG